MNTISRVFVVGQVTERERKKINDRNLAEFRLADFGLKLNAWGDLAVKVPESGVVMVEGSIKTRSYTNKEGQDRQSTEITVSSIEVLDVGSDDDLPF